MDINLGKEIAIGLREKGMTQVDLAKKMGVSRQQVTKWISNKTYPTADKLLEIISLLEIQDKIFHFEKFIEADEETYKKVEYLKQKAEIHGKILDELVEKYQKENQELNQEIGMLKAENVMLKAAVGDFRKIELITAMRALRTMGLEVIEDLEDAYHKGGESFINELEVLIRSQIKSATA